MSDRLGYSSPSSDARRQYEERLIQKQQENRAADTVSDGSSEETKAQKDFKAAAAKSGMDMAGSAAANGNLAGTAGGAMMMTGNPYLMAGGLGLTVLGAAEQNRRNQVEAQRKAYNDRVAARQKAMSDIAEQVRI